MERSQWFQQVADAVRLIVDDCGGAIVVTRESLREDAIVDNRALEACPQTIWDHLTCTLGPRGGGLKSEIFGNGSDGALLIHDPGVHANSAMAMRHVLKMGGIPPDVHIARLDVRPTFSSVVA